MPDALNNFQTTQTSTIRINMTDFLHLPLVEVLKLLVRGSVEEYLAEKESNASARAVNTANNECESLDMKGALEFLNSNGYPIKKGQLYKETSNHTIPHWKFNNKLHFKESELLLWAQGKLVDGNAVGVLTTGDKPKKKGGGR